MEKPRFKILIFMVLLLVMTVSFAWVYGDGEPDMLQTVVEASCTESGYIITTDPKSGSRRVQSLPATGHAFGGWIPDESAGTQSRTCSACGFQEQVRISSVDEALMPRLLLTGSMEEIGKKEKVVLQAEFSGLQQHFQCYAIMTLQGHSTYGFKKRNYTIRFYDDAQSVRKHRLQFKNWNREHKYILKANYMDLSQCRNLVGSRLWRSMAACRENLPRRIADLPCFGAVDGFPVDVYLNGEYFGLYTMNLHKDEDLYQMKAGERAALAICNHQTADESLFHSEAAFLPDYSSDWEIEFCGTEDESWARDSFNELIDFIMHSPDEAFRQGLSAHLDVEAAIDYLIFIYALGLPQSGAKDLVMLNYGDVWIPSAYDMDEAFGLNADLASYLSPEEFVPNWTGDAWSSGTGSLLWDRLLNAFGKEISARYAYLRKGVLTEENLVGMVEDFMGAIPETSYDMDMNLYADRPLDDPDMKTQIMAYISKRFAVLDSSLEALGQ